MPLRLCTCATACTTVPLRHRATAAGPLQAACTTFGQLLAAQLLVGVGGGGSLSVLAALTARNSPVEKRGYYLGLSQAQQTAERRRVIPVRRS